MANIFEMNDGKKLKYNIHTSKDAKGIVLIVHGMAEHIERYFNISEYLSSNGFTVYGYDHRGHGKSVDSIDELGFFDYKNGWDKVVEDLKTVIFKIKEDNKDIPIYILSHSMGTFIARDFASEYSDYIQGLICSGTGRDPKLAGRISLNLAKILVLLQGHKKPSNIIDKIMNISLNKGFKPIRTRNDWLTRDNIEVDKYNDDIYCGTVFSNQFYVDLLSGMIKVNREENINRIRKDLPIYLFSGDNDPVGENGKGVIEVFNKMKKLKIENIQMKLYKGGRHEMLNEINREKVYKDILNWLNS